MRFATVGSRTPSDPVHRSYALSDQTLIGGNEVLK